MRTYVWLLVFVAMYLSGCATPVSRAPTAFPAQPSASATPAAGASPTTKPASSTAAVATTPASAPTVPPATTVAPDRAPATPKEALLHALQLVDGEMRAAQASADLAETRRHAEAALNVSVGLFGRWYGDGDHDGKALDPSDGRGILPGERVPGPPPDVGTPVFPFGWAFLVLDNGNDAEQQVITALLGTVELWRSMPRRGYDEIEKAVTAGDAQKAISGNLSGSVPRVVAASRYILSKAQSLDEANRFAALGSAQSSGALEAARKLAP